MVKSCCVWNCVANTSNFPKRKFFILPKEKNRRRKWLEFIGRAKIQESGLPDHTQLWDPDSRYHYVCAAHFVTGVKSSDQTHPDYIPSVTVQPSHAFTSKQRLEETKWDATMTDSSQISIRIFVKEESPGQSNATESGISLTNEEYPKKRAAEVQQEACRRTTRRRKCVQDRLFPPAKRTNMMEVAEDAETSGYCCKYCDLKSDNFSIFWSHYFNCSKRFEDHNISGSVEAPSAAHTSNTCSSLEVAQVNRVSSELDTPIPETSSENTNCAADATALPLPAVFSCSLSPNKSLSSEDSMCCRYCEAHFFCPTEFWRHVKCHEGVTIKPYKCKVCGKSFGDSYQHKKHLERHETQDEQSRLPNGIIGQILSAPRTQRKHLKGKCKNAKPSSIKPQYGISNNTQFKIEYDTLETSDGDHGNSSQQSLGEVESQNVPIKMEIISEDESDLNGVRPSCAGICDLDFSMAVKSEPAADDQSFEMDSSNSGGLGIAPVVLKSEYVAELDSCGSSHLHVDNSDPDTQDYWPGESGMGTLEDEVHALSDRDVKVEPGDRDLRIGHEIQPIIIAPLSPEDQSEYNISCDQQKTLTDTQEVNSSLNVITDIKAETGSQNIDHYPEGTGLIVNQSPQDPEEANGRLIATIQDMQTKDGTELKPVRLDIPSGSPSLYCCPCCVRVFLLENNCADHLKSHLNGTLDSLKSTASFRCGFCRLVCESMKSLQEHISQSHVNAKPDRVHVCDKCGVRCASVSSLLRHAKQCKTSASRDSVPPPTP